MKNFVLRFFRKNKKHIIVSCKTDEVIINDQKFTFPTNYNSLVAIFGEPNRNLNKSKNYVFWDSLGIFCRYTDTNEIFSINFFQNKKDRSEYNTKKQFSGELFLNDENITNNEFDKISLGDISILRLGSENEIRYGFSIGVNKSYKLL